MMINCINKNNNNYNNNISSYSQFYKNKYTSQDNVRRSGVIFLSKTTLDLKLLVVKGKLSGIYSFPKGRHNNSYESNEECAIREVYEETGIKLNHNDIENSHICKIGRNTYFILESCENKYNNFRINDTNEVCEVAWKTISELKELICNKDIRNILQYPSKKFRYHEYIYL